MKGEIERELDADRHASQKLPAQTSHAHTASFASFRHALQKHPAQTSHAHTESSQKYPEQTSHDHTVSFASFRKASGREWKLRDWFPFPPVMLEVDEKNSLILFLLF